MTADGEEPDQDSPRTNSGRARTSNPNLGRVYQIVRFALPLTLLAAAIFVVYRDPTPPPPLPPDPFTACLRGALAKSTVSFNHRSLDNALDLARQKELALEIDNTNMQTQEVRMLTEPAVVKAIRACRLDASLSPPKPAVYQGVVTVLRDLGEYEAAVEGATIDVVNRSERVTRLGQGRYALELTAVEPTTSITLLATAPTRPRSQLATLTVRELVENGATLVVSEQ